MSVFGVILVHIFQHLDSIRRDTEYLSVLSISPYSVRMRENAGKTQTRITPNTDTFLRSECSYGWYLLVHVPCYMDQNIKKIFEFRYKIFITINLKNKYSIKFNICNIYFICTINTDTVRLFEGNLFVFSCDYTRYCTCATTCRIVNDNFPVLTICYQYVAC